jgi:glycosyltransferase involved in cell wall biosynthesis
LHIAALVDRPDHVCCRYRVAAFAAQWRQAGHELELISWPRHLWGWFQLGRRLRHADVVIAQRKLLRNWQLCLLRRAARRLVFDFDDAVFLRDSYSRRGLRSGGRARRFAAVVGAADAVVAGNDFLAAAARRHTRFDRVHVVPTCVEPARYPLADHEHNPDAVQLVWVGSSSTLQGLEAIRPMLEALGNGLPTLRLKLICDRFLELKHLLVVPCPWREADEACEIAAADIGISWVPDDDWSRGKCGLKVLQYMAAGLPVVANPVGVHPEMVRPGVTGFLPRTQAEWAEAIIELGHKPGVRRQLGGQARALVEERYSVAFGAERWLEVLGTLALPLAA